MKFYLVSNFGTIVRILSGIGLSVFFGIFAFFVVQSVYVLTGGSWGYWPKPMVIIAWFYLPGLFGSLGSFLPIWIYSEYSIMYKAFAIIIVIIFVILVSYFTFNLTSLFFSLFFTLLPYCTIIYPPFLPQHTNNVAIT